MQNLTYHLARSAEGQVITVFVPGQGPKSADHTHPKFQAIRALLANEEVDVDEFMALFESKTPVRTIERMFSQLTDRISARDGKLYFDGDEFHGSVADVALRLMDEGKDFMPVVRFLEKIHDNPNEHSREQAYRWISSQKLTITANGDVVGYKGCRLRADGIPESTSSGKATVDGIEYIGRIPYPFGSVATMPRSKVVHDPGDACSTGLHVGTYSYACGFGNTVVEVHVNPRDIVSVPNGENEKMRVCRLKVIKKVEGKYAAATRTTHAPLPQERYAEPAPVVDSEFADCVTCETCGECKTHDECICAEAARQQTNLDAENSELRVQRQKPIREAAQAQGLDWEPEWTEGPAPVASFGRFRAVADKDGEGLCEGDEGTLKAEIVGAREYSNERVMFFLEMTEDLMSEVDPHMDVEYVGSPADEIPVSTPAEVAQAFEVDESGLEPESLYDDEEEKAHEQMQEEQWAEAATAARGWRSGSPSVQEWQEMKARAQRRRRNFAVYAQQTGKWTLISGDGSEPQHWDVPRESEEVPAFEDIQSVVIGASDAYTAPSEAEFVTMAKRAKRRRRNFVKYASGQGWTLRRGDGKDRLDWEIGSKDDGA